MSCLSPILPGDAERFAQPTRDADRFFDQFQHLGVFPIGKVPKGSGHVTRPDHQRINPGQPEHLLEFRLRDALFDLHPEQRRVIGLA